MATRYRYNGVNIDVHIEGEGETLEMICLQGKKTEPLTQITLNNGQVIAKVNCNYFEDGSSSIYGQSYGVRQGITEDGLPLDEKPEQKPWIVTAIKSDRTIVVLNTTEYWLRKKDVICAFSPAVVCVHNGLNVEYISSGSEKGIDTLTSQTMFMKLDNGKFAIGVTQGNITARKLREWAKSIGVIHLSLLDSGGSCQMIENGLKIRYTGRKIKDVLAFCAVEKSDTFNYRNPNDLVKWALEQKEKPNKYNLDAGIGRYIGDTRQFDCTGLIKCFAWKDYSQFNTSGYDASQDIKFSNYSNLMKPIKTIPEVQGLIVWQGGNPYEHAGIYLGNGQVIETTPKLDGTYRNKIVVSQFNDPNLPNYRGTWTHYFEYPYFEYEREEQKGMILEIIKEGMSFRSLPNGSVFFDKNVAVGTKFEVLELPKEKYADDDEPYYFQWVKVRRNDGKEGYVQYDHKFDYVIMYGNPTILDKPLTKGLTFGNALELLQKGFKLMRSGWNGKGMFVVYQKGYPEGIPCNKQTAEAWGIKEGDLFICNPYLQIKNVNGSHSMWVPSINDCLSNDWEVVE